MRSSDAAEINSLDDNLRAEDTASPSQKLNESPNKSDTTADTAGTKGSKHKSKTSESTPSKKDGKHTEAASDKIQLVDNITPAAHQENTIFCPESFNEVVLVPVQTFYSEWDEEIELNWTQILNFRNLLALRNFIEMGMQIAVMEEKVKYLHCIINLWYMSMYIEQLFRIFVINIGIYFARAVIFFERTSNIVWVTNILARAKNIPIRKIMNWNNCFSWRLSLIFAHIWNIQEIWPQTPIFIENIYFNTTWVEVDVLHREMVSR